MLDENPSSPRWSTTTKLVVALTLAAILIALFIQFRNIVGPLLLAVLLSYLIHPLVTRMYRRAHIPWRLAVTLLFLLIILVLLGLLTWGGVTVVEQVQSLIGFVQIAVENLPAQIQDISHQSYQIGPFVLNVEAMDLQQLYTQILGLTQTVLSRMGTLVGTFASSAASILGWLLFVLLIAYFILTETEGTTNRLIYMSIPGYEDDINRLGIELGRIWNAFVRGQFLIIVLTVLLYTVLLGILGVRYYFGLALLAGMARFLPYIGPAIAWTTYGLVSYFQGHTLFGIAPLTYTAIVVGIAWVTDNIIDSLISPRVMADSLSVHPAAVMVAALVGLNLFGVIGVILAAPVLASTKLIFQYLIMKLSDRDPWESTKGSKPIPPLPPVIESMLRRLERMNGWSQKKIEGLGKRNPPWGAGK